MGQLENLKDSMKKMKMLDAGVSQMKMFQK
jgi:hypothetical protein